MENLNILLQKILSVICVVLFILMTIIGVWQVASRFVFNNPAAWTEETLTYSFTALCLFAAALVFSKREHMRLTFIIDKFPENIKKVLEILTEITIIVFSTSIFIYGGLSISKLTMTQITPALQLAMGTLYYMLPVTGVLIDIFCINNIINIATGKYIIVDEKEDR